MRPHQLSAVHSAYRNIRQIAHHFTRTFALVVFLIVVPQRVYAVDWVPISGKIQFEGTPLCALVLANGQHMFSCGGNGDYNLTVPLDANGTITLFAFVSGFSPFKQVLTAGESAIYNVGIARSDAARELQVTHTITPISRANWVNISGTVLENGLPVCAMALANGQQMFTCGNSLGRFSMEVPLDSKGEVTLFNFASGFSPSKKSISGGGSTGGRCTSGVYGCLTITGSSQVPDTFVPTDKITGVATDNESLYVVFDELDNVSLFDTWSLDVRIVSTPFSFVGARIYFGKSFRGVEYTCESGIIGSYGDCSGATFDNNTRTVTFSNVKLQAPGFGTVITVNGTLRYNGIFRN